MFAKMSGVEHNINLNFKEKQFDLFCELIQSCEDVSGTSRILAPQ